MPGTEPGVSFDYLVVNCDIAREAISALLDGEVTRVHLRVLDDHLAACAECRRWQALAHEVTRNVRLEPARPVTVRSDVLVGSVLARSRPPRRPTPLTWARVALVAVAVAQAAITAPLLIYGRDHAAPMHVAHEEGAFAMALALGFLVAAWRPDRAKGMRTVVGATAALLVVTAVADLAGGRTGIGDEAPHLLAVVGWLLLAYIAAATPSTTFDPSWSLKPVLRAVTGRRVPVTSDVDGGTAPRRSAPGRTAEPVPHADEPGRREVG
jgi:predicted anti-sigma-YlaC factor YlaD